MPTDTKPRAAGPIGLLARIVLPLVLVYSTWNPSGRSFYHWAIQPIFNGTATLDPGKILVGLVLVAGWVVVVGATRRSLGLGGTVLVTAIFAVLAWFLIDRGIFRPQGAAAMAHVALVALSLVLAVGLSWAILMRKATGQVEVDSDEH